MANKDATDENFTEWSAFPSPQPLQHLLFHLVVRGEGQMAMFEGAFKLLRPACNGLLTLETCVHHVTLAT